MWERVVIHRLHQINALAVSILVINELSEVLLVRRTDKVGIGQGLFGVTVTGSVDEEDLNAADPIRSCALRELSEELGLHLTNDDLQVKTLVAGKVKRQPVAVINARVKGSLVTVAERARKAKDYSFEVAKMVVCAKSDVKALLENQKFTEAAEYHLLNYLQ